MSRASLAAVPAADAPRNSYVTWLRANWAVPGVAAITAIGLIWRLALVAREPLWLDEGYTLLFSKLPLMQVITIGGTHEHPPLYYLLCHALLSLNSSPLVPRCVSLVLGTLLIPAVYMLGSQLVSRSLGVAAAAIIAVSPLAIWYSDDGRAYALASLMVCLSYLAILKASKDETKAWWVTYALCTLACLYTEYTTAFALLPQALFLLRGPRRRLCLVWAAVVAGFLPWLGVLAGNTADVASDYWIPVPTVQSVEITALQFLGLRTPCTSPPCNGQSPAGIFEARALIALGLSLVLVAFIAWAVRSRSINQNILWLWALAPFAVVLALAPVRSLYLDRVFVDTLPAFVLLLLAGIWAFPAVARAGAIVIWLCISAGTSTLLASQHENPNWPALARDVSAAYQKGDAVVYYPGVAQRLTEAAMPGAWNPTSETPMWFRSYLDVPGWVDRYPTQSDIQLRDIELKAAARGHDRIWLVAIPYTGLPYGRHWFPQHGFRLDVSETYDPGDIRLELWTRTDRVRSWHGVQGKPHGEVKVPQKICSKADVFCLRGKQTVSVTVPLKPGHAYAVHLRHLALPGTHGFVQLIALNHLGRPIATFPHTKWYDIPANGVWADLPFGFVTPPDTRQGRLVFSNRSGITHWTNVQVGELK